MIEVRRLRVLRALADHGTVTAAAEVLHLTPSAVSQQLAALESEVGQELLERRGRRVAITSAGRLLLTHADRILTEVERAEDAMHLHANGTTGEVRIAAFATAISLLVAPTLPILRESVPGLRLSVSDAEGHQAIARLLDNEIDLAIAVEHRGSPRPDDERLARIPLYAEPFVAVVHRSHSLATTEAVDLTALSTDDWVMTSTGNPIRDVVLLACEQAGFQPRVAHTSDDFRSVAALVAANAGVSLVPRLAIADYNPTDAVLLPLIAPTPVRRVFAATRKARADHPLITATITALQKTATTLPVTF
ncbi:LysR family transcriptional regulator [Kribbella sp. NPDC051718]|uniref:LysR family transcriptional regulator n=1 Tax=Kribbella sp. NPDC051718 TaxID=3155168 RepID=UPI00343F5F68